MNATTHEALSLDVLRLQIDEGVIEALRADDYVKVDGDKEDPGYGPYRGSSATSCVRLGRARKWSAERRPCQRQLSRHRPSPLRRAPARRCGIPTTKSPPGFGSS